MKSGRPGIVLPATIGLLVLIELLVVVTLAIAYQEVMVARERVAGVSAQLAGRSTLTRHTARVQDELQFLRPGTRRSFAPESTANLVVTSAVERLTGSMFVLRATSEWFAGQTRARITLGLLTNGLDPEQLLARLPAALNVFGAAELHGSAVIDALAANEIPFGWPATACELWLDLPDSTAALSAPPDATLLVAGAAMLNGVPPIDSTGSHALLALAIIASAGPPDRMESGTVELLAVSNGGLCTTAAPGNWGVPFDDSHPCGRYFPFIRAVGNLTVSGGAGQGTLLVDGDLTLGPGVSFVGMVLVRGRLSLGPGARITGLAAAQSAVLDGGSVDRSSCAATRALFAAPAFNRLKTRQGRAWIPLF